MYEFKKTIIFIKGKDTMAQTKWVIDPAHSELSFKVKHLMISNVKGAFKNFSGEAVMEGTTLVADSIKVQVEIASIFTNSEERDGHLKSADFFEAEKYPEMTFVGKSIVNEDGEDLKLTGDLTIKGVTKEVVFDVELGGVSTDPWGNEKTGLSLSTKINRKDFGLVWNVALETGGVLVGEEVKIAGDIELGKQA
jgi:polyisoprenoid-binding protein YceI